MTSDRVRQYYNHFDEWGRKASAAGRLEFVRTLAILDRYIAPESRILDLGGGPGHYTIALAERGHTVALADLSPKQLAIARERIREADVEDRVESIAEVDATDLANYEDESFDAVLALGPFYHLTAMEDRCRAASEIIRVIKPGATTIVAFMPRMTFVRHLIWRAADTPDQVTPAVFSETVSTGIFSNPSKAGFQSGYCSETHELRALFEGAGLHTESVMSIRGIAYGYEEALWQIQDRDEELFERIVADIEQTQEDPATIAYGGHALYIGRKPLA